MREELPQTVEGGMSPEAKKELKELLAFVVAMVQGIGDSIEDGKFSLTDLFKFFKALRKSAAAFKGLDALKGQLSKMTEEDKKELSDYVADELDLANDVLESYIEQALAVAISLLDLIPLSKQLKKK